MAYGPDGRANASAFLGCVIVLAAVVAVAVIALSAFPWTL